VWELLEAIARIALKQRPGPIVEIGIGASTRIFAKIAQEYDLPYYTCDIKKHSQMFEGHTIFVGRSLEFIQQIDVSPALVFLDGCHNYGVVKQEFECFAQRLLENGIIFMHDTLPPTRRHLQRGKCSNSWKLRQELEDCVDYNCFTFPYTARHCGLTMVMKKPRMFAREVVSGGEKT
jgi:hypothetical protein